MKINREEFLKQLESVMPGLSPKEIIEQSSCFVFIDKMVHTYNDEISCSQESLLKVDGAVPALPFISILRKLEEDELDIKINDENSELLIRGKKRRAGIRIDSKVLLPIEEVDKPKKWKELPANFADAIAIVQPCAGNNEAQFNMTCIHLTPDWIEACNNHQVARFKIKMDISKSTLVRKESLRHILSLDMTEFSETKHWIHFRNPTGLVLSCRYFIEDYPSDDITEVLKVRGTKLVLPKGLREAIEKAEVFSAENVEGNDVSVRIQPGELRIEGKGISGWFRESKKLEYDGKDLEFTIPSKLLSELVKQYNKCEVTENRLKVRGGKFTYVTTLGVVEEKE